MLARAKQLALTGSSAPKEASRPAGAIRRPGGAAGPTLRRPSLVKLPEGKQRKAACPTCEAKAAASTATSTPSDAGTGECTQCRANTPRLEGPPTATQRKTPNSAAKHPAEHQADAIGTRIGEDIASAGNVASGLLPDSIRAVAEQHLGVSLAGTELRGDDQGHGKATAERALAVTEGSTISFRKGQLSSATPEGRALLGHELTHVAQQRAAGTPATQLAPEGEGAEAQKTEGTGPKASTPEPAQCVPPTDASVDTQMCAAPDESAPKEKPKPEGETIDFEGVKLAPGRKYLRHILEEMVAVKGEEHTRDFVQRFISPSTDSRIKNWQKNWDNKELIAEIRGQLGGELEQLESDNKAFIGLFEQMCIASTRELLNNSKARIESELEHYGIKDDGIIFDSYSASNDDAIKGLKAAALELANKRREVNAVASKHLKSWNALSQGAKDDPFLISLQGMKEQAEADRKAWLDKEEEYRAFSGGKHKEYPILAAYSTTSDAVERLEKLAAMSSEDMAEAIAEEAKEKLENIEKVRSELGGRFSIWKQPHIMKIAQKQLSATPMQVRVVSDHARKVEAAEEDSKTLFAVVAIGLGLLAAIPTGGSSLLAGVAAAATIVGAGFTIYNAYEHLAEYSLEMAATGTDFDKANAIAQDEPSLFWLALDLVSAGLDIFGAARAFRELANLIKAVNASGIAKLPMLLEATRKAGLSADATERVLLSITRRGDAVNTTLRIIDAVGAAFRHVDMVEVLARIEKFADAGFNTISRSLYAQKRVLPLTEQGLRAALPVEAAEALIKKGILENSGLYHQFSGYLFIKPGTVDDVASTIVHEATHWLETTSGGKFALFLQEYQAAVMEQRFVQRLAQAEGIQNVPADLLWFIGANEERIAQHVVDTYGVERLTDEDGRKAVQYILEKLQVFN